MICACCHKESPSAVRPRAPYETGAALCRSCLDDLDTALALLDARPEMGAGRNIEDVERWYPVVAVAGTVACQDRDCAQASGPRGCTHALPHSVLTCAALNAGRHRDCEQGPEGRIVWTRCGALQRSQ
jgi:hypothetical protein